jgi:hypothetical protein
VTPLGALLQPVRRLDPALQPDRRFTCVDVACLSRGLQAPAALRGDEAPRRARQLLEPGDVLLSTVRPQAALAPAALEGALASTAIAVLRPRPPLAAAYLVQALRFALERGLLRLAGAVVPSLGLRALRALRIPLPGPDRQRAIAARLERAEAEARRLAEALARADALRPRLARALALRALGDAPARPLGELARLTGGWRPRGLGERLAAERAGEGSLAWLTVGDLARPENQPAVVVAGAWLPAGAAADLGLTPLPPGALVLPRRGESIALGRRGVLGAPAALDVNLAAAVPAPGLEAWLALWLGSVDLSGLVGGGALPSLRRAQLAALPVPLPPAPARRRALEGWRRERAALLATRVVAPDPQRAVAGLRARLLGPLFQAQ